MSKYKVIYRDDNLSWQELCPVRMLAIQVARDTETGTCFLQTKLVNVTSQTISRIEFTIDLTGEDGKRSRSTLRFWMPTSRAAKSLDRKQRRSSCRSLPAQRLP